MKLSIQEFIQFHLGGRWKLLISKGVFLLRKDLGSDWIDLYCIFGFYVEVFFEKSSAKPFRVEPLHSSRMLEFYLQDISLSSIETQLQIK
jgi:hypothetical protein